MKPIPTEPLDKISLPLSTTAVSDKSLDSKTGTSNTINKDIKTLEYKIETLFSNIKLAHGKLKNSSPALNELVTYKKTFFSENHVNAALFEWAQTQSSLQHFIQKIDGLNIQRKKFIEEIKQSLQTEIDLFTHDISFETNEKEKARLIQEKNKKIEVLRSWGGRINQGVTTIVDSYAKQIHLPVAPPQTTHAGFESKPYAEITTTAIQETQANITALKKEYRDFKRSFSRGGGGNLLTGPLHEKLSGYLKQIEALEKQLKMLTDPTPPLNPTSRSNK